MGGFFLYIALAMGVAPCIPGFLGTIGAIEVASIWISLYHYAWFISFGLAFSAHIALTRIAGSESRS